jgi:hypothetical protein
VNVVSVNGVLRNQSYSPGFCMKHDSQPFSGWRVTCSELRRRAVADVRYGIYKRRFTGVIRQHANLVDVVGNKSVTAQR